jgi:hypothetical protein
MRDKRKGGREKQNYQIANGACLCTTKMDEGTDREQMAEGKLVQFVSNVRCFFA